MTEKENIAVHVDLSFILFMINPHPIWEVGNIKVCTNCGRKLSLDDNPLSIGK